MIRESFKMRKLQWGPSERWCQPTRAHHDPFRHVHLDSGPYFRRSLPQSAAVTLALSLMLATLWLLLHRYGGITKDAQVYAFQALARLHPALATDLYLRNSSPDHYTVFSPLYASLISVMGLSSAALLLMLVCKIWFLGAAWTLARDLAGRNTAWLTVALLIITVGRYGGNGVLHFAEDYLSARSMAEALVVTALACHFRGLKRLGLLISVATLLVHPLMALPGLLLLTCLWLPTRPSIFAAIAGILVIFGIACADRFVPAGGNHSYIIGTTWLEVVRERADFLFVQLWSINDLKLNAGPFICLTISATAIPDRRTRKLCIGAILVGSAGLAVAFVASVIDPIAILVQGQPWRWVWVTSLCCILLLPETALRVWKDERCGPACALLLVLGWTFPAIDGAYAVSLALILWLVRARISSRVAQWLRVAAVALGIVVLLWALANCWTVATSSLSVNTEPFLAQMARNVVGLQIPAVFLFVFFLGWIMRIRSTLAPTLVCMILLVFGAVILPGSFPHLGPVGSFADSKKFGEWQAAIPATSSVFVADGRNSGEFVWFTLLRTNYLTATQSTGVVFSRATAFEVQRRSEVLLPLMNPSWKIFTNNALIRGGESEQSVHAVQPLTERSLVAICSDPELGFVVSRENIGFEPLRHRDADEWKDWNLYDCRRVRDRMAAT
jgi:hypothetical protein